ncbi:hypothetical protein PSECIP111951_02757 [Pseudoalteromonas holothuriae]|uniref:Cardiolipin synthase N-terminal domain-containing protein n=1 Tax=Pseudoalteromonas holothuriae TaxID=2963714 RepID=A0A9W4QVL1_9GAMM|nr:MULTISPECIES: hypothetical protein [unclassified Pseudoalteromonas]CAH9055222.1 hypothetical protein PSECIP111854_01535 [Pseudoalteromonas sp. CIP111854]CAH9062739.1 hypothetical protein PSECIP111951_02757 [Pseudoalteromonas sp. CIP111951]
MSELILLCFAVCAYLIPVGVIVGSKRTKGHEKNGWLIASLVFSWLTLLLYFSIVPKEGVQSEKPKKGKAHTDR